MAFVYALRANFDSGASEDALGRVYGDVTEMFHATGLNNPDPNAVWPEIFAAPVDTSSSDSVAGSTLRLGHVHPYYDGTTDPNFMDVGGKRPLSTVKGHKVVRPINYREVIVAVQYRTTYISTSFGGSGDLAVGVTKFRQEVYEDTPIFKGSDIPGGGTRYDRDILRRQRVVSYYTNEYLSDEFPDANALRADEAKLAAPVFIQPPGGGGPEVKLLYLGAGIRKDGASWRITEYFKDVSPLRELTVAELGLDWIEVPAIPALADLSVEFSVSGVPAYIVRTPEQLYEEIPPG